MNKRIFSVLAVLCLLTALLVGCGTPSKGGDAYAGTNWVSDTAVETARPLFAKLYTSSLFLYEAKVDKNEKPDFKYGIACTELERKRIRVATLYPEMHDLMKKTSEEQETVVTDALTYLAAAWQTTGMETYSGKFFQGYFSWGGENADAVDAATKAYKEEHPDTTKTDSEISAEISVKGYFNATIESVAEQMTDNDILTGMKYMVANSLGTYETFECICFGTDGTVTIPGSFLDKEGRQTIKYNVTGYNAYFLVSGVKIYELASSGVMSSTFKKTAAFNDQEKGKRNWTQI